jgi:hypothetical protein
MPLIHPQIFSLIVVLCTGAVTWLATRYWTQKATLTQDTLRSRGEQLAMLARIELLEKQLAVVGQAVVPISAVFQQILIKELTHVRTPRMDELLVKLGPPYTLTRAEEEELWNGLEQRMNDMGDQMTASERDAARMLPFVMKRVKTEFAALVATALTFKMISEAGIPPDEQQRLSAP